MLHKVPGRRSLLPPSPEALRNPKKYKGAYMEPMGKIGKAFENRRKRCFGTGTVDDDGSDVGGDGDLIYFHWQGCSWNHLQF